MNPGTDIPVIPSSGTAVTSAGQGFGRSFQERPRYRLTGAGVIRAEWSKFWSLRSSPITLGITLVLLLAVGVLTSALFHPGNAPTSTSTTIPTGPVSLALSGVSLAQIAIGVLAVLVTAGEYSTGMIRSTLIAVPRRLPVLWAKAASYAGISFAVALLGAVLAFVIGSTVLPDSVVHLSIANAGVARALAGAALYLALVGAIGVALGALTRSAAGGITVLVASLLILPTLLMLLPSSASHALAPYLPSNAGQAISAIHHTGNQLSPAAGAITLMAWTAVALAAAAWRLVKTDA